MNDARRAFRLRQADVEQVSGVGCAHTAGLAFAITCDHVEIQFVVPEVFFDCNAHGSRTMAPVRGGVLFAAVAGKRGHDLERGVGIALYFDQGEGALRQASIGVEHRITAVFPALVGKAAFLAARVSEKAVLIQVATLDDLFRSGDQRRP